MPEAVTDPLVAESAGALRRDGFLLLEHVIDEALVEQMRTAFEERHRVPTDGNPRDMLRVGDRRFQVTVRLRPPFTDPRLFGSPVLRGVLGELLGSDGVLVGFNAVVSQPGAEDQHVHADTGGLFGDDAGEAALPTYAISAIVPLVDMDETTGTTRVWPGTHRLAETDRAGIAPHDPIVRRGSVLLMDYRLQHGGLRNRSARPRPILALTFARAWFRDAENYSRQPPLHYGPLDRRRMAPELRELLPPAASTTLDDRVAATTRKAVAKMPAKLKRVATRLGA